MRYSTLMIVALLAGACSAPVTPAASPPAADPSARPPVEDPVIEIAGEPEVVFDWTRERCADNEIPDLPTRALRTADGRVQLSIPSTTNYRLIGADFDSLENDCEPVLLSNYDRNPARYNHSEWLAAAYTLDGRTIHAIVHQEYHGDQAGSVWQAGADFSPRQGNANWLYQSWTGSAYVDMSYDSAGDRWLGARSLCLIGSQWMHPDIDCQPSRTWVSPVSGTVTVNGRAYDSDPNGGNGVMVRILKGNQELWSATLENGDTTGQTYELAVEVQEGDRLHFRVHALGNSDNDTTFFDPGINIGPAPCPSNDHSLCTLISLTYAVSTDGGRTYSQPPAPDHLIASFPYRYDPEVMRALWQPSNIVLNPKDGFYYALIQVDEHIPASNHHIQGMCVMRTAALDDPASWRAWDGTGFGMRFLNPYLETEADPQAHRCTLVTPEIGALTYGLTYNTYFEKFIAVGVGGRPRPGFYYALSEDLIHWTPRQFLMDAPQSFVTGPSEPFWPYPSILDPDSPSPSFDVSGRTPFLYFSRFFSNDPWSADLMRVQLELRK